MARKLRLEVGDYVARWHQNVPTLGRVQDRGVNSKDDMRSWGVYSYTIFWLDSKQTHENWSIRDMLSGHLTYIKNPDALEILYGKKV